MSNNLSEEAFAYAKQLKRKVIMFTSTNIRLDILFFIIKLFRLENLREGSWKTAMHGNKIWNICVQNTN